MSLEKAFAELASLDFHMHGLYEDLRPLDERAVGDPGHRWYCRLKLSDGQFAYGSGDDVEEAIDGAIENGIDKPYLTFSKPVTDILADAGMRKPFVRRI